MKPDGSAPGTERGNDPNPPSDWNVGSSGEFSAGGPTGSAYPVAYPLRAPSGPLELAEALLVEAERHPDPRPLIAAARVLLARVGREGGENRRVVVEGA